MIHPLFHTQPALGVDQLLLLTARFTSPPEVLKALFPLTDLILFQILANGFFL